MEKKENEKIKKAKAEEKEKKKEKEKKEGKKKKKNEKKKEKEMKEKKKKKKKKGEMDAKFMRRALSLAAKARGQTHPNPMVGCVIVRDGEVVGEGYHPRAGMPHAEVYALRGAGRKARGATAYVTLEPCSHYGRTPPCALALLNAGVTKVVVAMADPNPVVSSVDSLREAGLEVVVGVEEEAARELNEDFISMFNAPSS